MQFEGLQLQAFFMNADKVHCSGDWSWTQSQRTLHLQQIGQWAKK